MLTAALSDPSLPHRAELVTVVLIYFQLCNEDYHWWWRAYLTPGSSALYLYLYSIVYFFSKLQMVKFVSGLLFFGYMFLVCVAFFVLTGTIGQKHAQMQSTPTPTRALRGRPRRIAPVTVCPGGVSAVLSRLTAFFAILSLSFVPRHPQASSPRSCSCARSTRRSRSIKKRRAVHRHSDSLLPSHTAHHSLAHLPSLTSSASATEATLTRPSLLFFRALSSSASMRRPPLRPVQRFLLSPCSMCKRALCTFRDKQTIL